MGSVDRWPYIALAGSAILCLGVFFVLTYAPGRRRLATRIFLPCAVVLLLVGAIGLVADG